jgi:hypothetical protein
MKKPGRFDRALVTERNEVLPAGAAETAAVSATDKGTATKATLAAVTVETGTKGDATIA